MALLIEAEFTGKAARVEVGADTQGRPKIRIEMQVVGGEHDGKRFPYDGKLNEDNIKYTKAAMLAVGWAGKDIRTFVTDVEKAGVVVPFSTRIANYKRDDGSVNEWTAVQKIGGAPPLAKLDDKKLADVNQWFAAVGEEERTPF